MKFPFNHKKSRGKAGFKCASEPVCFFAFFLGCCHPPASDKMAAGNLTIHPVMIIARKRSEIHVSSFKLRKHFPEMPPSSFLYHS